MSPQMNYDTYIRHVFWPMALPQEKKGLSPSQEFPPSSSPLKRAFSVFRFILFFALMGALVLLTAPIEKLPSVVYPWIFVAGGIIVLFIILIFFYFLMAPKSVKLSSSFELETTATLMGGIAFAVGVVFYAGRPAILGLGLLLIAIYAYAVFRVIKDTLNAQEENEAVRRQYGQLLKIDREKSDFITVTSHQLRTPLSAIRWALDGAQQAPELTDETRETIKNGLDNISRLTKVVDDMFKAQELENQGQAPLKKEPLNFTSLIEEAITGAQSLVREKNVALTFNRSDRELLGFGDREKLKSAIKIVIDNAIRYSPNGTVVVSLRTEGNRANIRVEDSGIGITKEESALIFTRFFRGKNALLVQPDGSGIGLYTARNIIERHGGEINFFSQPGRGTIFIISLPLA